LKKDEKKTSSYTILDTVVYKPEGNEKVIITFYPGRIKQYDKK